MDAERKRALRAQMKGVRATLTGQGLDDAAAAVAQRVIALPELAEPRLVGCYLSIRRELPTGPVLAALQAAGHAIAVPRVVDRHHIEFRAYVLPLVPDAAGIPTSDGPVVDGADVVLCPGLAFDLRGGRLGYGAGYYDRWLADHPGAQPIGLAIDAAVVDDVPMGPDDRPMIAIVTPTRVVRCATAHRW